MQARLSLHLLKYHIVGNHMSRFISSSAHMYVHYLNSYHNPVM